VKRGLELNMGLRDRKPIKKLKEGDSISTKVLKANGLLKDTPLSNSVRTWKVESMVSSDIQIQNKKRKITAQKTVIVLVNGKGEKQKRTRTFWID
jgi:hypothetical protein